MTDKPLISVIVPIYNVEEYLDHCVESIVNQTYRNLEIILVDDGSPDNCNQICDGWAEKDYRIKVLHKENGGLSDARNAGLRIANGDYIAFVDSDDWIESFYIEYLFRAMVDSDADLAACDVCSVNDGEEVTPINISYSVSQICNAEEALSQLIKGKRFRAVAWNKLYSRKIIANEYFEVGKLHEDEFFTFRIFDKCEKLVYVDIPLYNYRQREGSIMAVWSDRHLDACDAAILRLQMLKEKYPLLYKNDLVTFCIGCSNMYIIALQGKFVDNKRIKKKLKAYRKQIKISFHDFLEYCVRDKVFIIGSKPLLIGAFSRMRMIRGI